VVFVPADVPAAVLPPVRQEEPAEYPAPVPADTSYYAEDERPWEREGFVRRDCEPHRGGLVQTLGIVSLCCLIGFLCGGILVTGPGLGLGIAAWVMGSRDLARMNRGDMDPAGMPMTRTGRTCGMIGTMLNGFCAVGYCGFFAVLLTGRAW